MRYSSSTVASLMSLVDEHKEDVTEASYVEMCNALKYLHDQCSSRENQQLLPQPPIPTESPQRSPIQVRIDSLENQIRINEARYFETGRVTNADKIKVFEMILRSHSIEFRPSPERTNTRVAELKHLILQHAHTFREVMPHLTRMFQEIRNERREEERLVTRANITRLRSQIEILRQTVTTSR